MYPKEKQNHYHHPYRAPPRRHHHGYHDHHHKSSDSHDKRNWHHHRYNRRRHRHHDYQHHQLDAAGDNSNRVEKYTRHNTSTTVCVELPWDIICLILARLPIKSLLRFTTVSKSFYRLTNDPQFKKIQSSQANTSHQGDSYIICRNVYEYNNIYMFSDSDDTDMYLAGEEPTKIPVHPKLKRGTETLALVATCNGLLFLANIDTGDGWIYNPITKERIALAPIDSGRVYKHFRSSFGFDATSNKYKVAAISPVKLTDDVHAAYVITIGEKSWRKLDLPIHYQRGIWNGCIFFHGKFYWTMHEYMFSMNISDEHIRFFDFDVGKLVCPEPYELVDFGKHLFMVVYRRHPARIRFWVLVDSEKGIWEYQSTLDMSSFMEEINDEGTNIEIKVIAPSKNGNLILLLCPVIWSDTNKLLISYTPPTHKEEQKHDNLYCKVHIDATAFPFKPSLAPLSF